ncbi:unnamed protein product, partial [Polarella glacialis]
MRKHMKRCCPEKLPERAQPVSEARQTARREASGDDWISEEEVKEEAVKSVAAMKDPLLRQVLELRFGLDTGGHRRTPAEVADALGGKYRGNAQAGLTLIRQALRSIPLVMDDPKDLVILYEDEHLLAVSKPPFLRCTPVHRFTGKSLTNQILGLGLQRRSQSAASGKGDSGEPEQPMLLHRLDQTTSGVVLCAKTKSAAAFCHERWHGPDCKKEYLAIGLRSTDAKLEASIGASLVVSAPIGPDKDSDDPVRRAVNYEEGQSAATRFEVLAVGRNGSLLLACTLEESGRTHQ